MREQLIYECQKEYWGEGKLFYFNKRLFLNIQTREENIPASEAIYELPIPDDEIEFGDNNIAFIPGFNALPDSPINFVNADEKETMENPFYYLLYTIIQHYKLSKLDIHIILDMLLSNTSIEREPLSDILFRTQKLNDEELKEKYKEVKEGEIEW